MAKAKKSSRSAPKKPAGRTKHSNPEDDEDIQLHPPRADRLHPSVWVNPRGRISRTPPEESPETPMDWRERAFGELAVPSADAWGIPTARKRVSPEARCAGKRALAALVEELLDESPE